MSTEVIDAQESTADKTLRSVIASLPSGVELENLETFAEYRAARECADATIRRLSEL